jgi:hypothetical protein
MQLHERLMDLIGHEVHVRTRTEDEDRDVPGGTLKEIGLDYLIIDTTVEEELGDVGASADWWVRLEAVIVILHPHDCRKCAVDGVLRQ